MISLDIFADPVCPFSLIGKTELDRALEQRPDHPFSIVWHPFRLNPQMPRAGMPRLDYMRMKFGDGNDGLGGVVGERFATLGLTPNPSETEPNTTDAHRLMHWAGLEGLQSRVMDALLRAYWLQARNIGDPVVLRQIAESTGMDGPAVARLLDSDADLDEVDRKEAHARKHGINSVPTFVIANQHVAPGAQPAELWLRVIDELAEQ